MESKPLALRRQRVVKRARTGSFRILVDVLVEHESFHLADIFTYGIPDSMQGVISEGAWVRVPFQGRDLDGVVVAIRTENATAVKPVLKIHSFQPISPSLLKLSRDVSTRYGCRIVDVIRFIPKFPICDPQITSKSKGKYRVAYRSFLHFPFSSFVEALVKSEVNTLVIVATERMALDLVQSLSTDANKAVIHYDATGTAQSRKSALQRIQTLSGGIVIGTRSAIFLDIPELSRLYLIGELSDHFWERRFPYWNVRDVALLRARNENLDMEIISGAPSMEISRLIQLGAVHFEKRLIRSRNRRRFTFDPNTYHSAIREGLKNGAVLVSVEEKSYSSSFICGKCRSMPRCRCGGRLILSSRDNHRCFLCGEDHRDWRCAECGSAEKLLLRRGAERIHEELGKAFPNTRIEIATSDRDQVQISDRVIVVATAGMEPIGVEYDALVLLDGEIAFNRPLLRSSEILLDRWFTLLARTRLDASIYVSLVSSNPVSQALLKGDFSSYIKEELAERREVSLPPWFRIIEVSGAEGDLQGLVDHLKTEFDFSYVSLASDSKRIILRVPVDRSEMVIASLYTLQKYRSATRQKHLEIKIDQLQI